MNLPEFNHPTSSLGPRGKPTRSRRLDQLSRTRLSKNFILRDFLFCASAAENGFSNFPDNEQQVISAGSVLCEKILEPVLEVFGRFAITYGYQNGESINHDLRREHPGRVLPLSSPHHWDRHKGAGVYARVDILPYCVEDGLISKAEFGRWLMLNLDIDLLMDWSKSNVFCITVSPKPRRSWIGWGRPSKGEPRQTVRMSPTQWRAETKNLFSSHDDSLRIAIARPVEGRNLRLDLCCLEP